MGWANQLHRFFGNDGSTVSVPAPGHFIAPPSWSVAMHMGNQYGMLTRILATVACLGLLTSITTAMLMWWKRRPTGGTGLPGRTSDAQRGDTPRGAVAAIAVIATALAVLYPSFGVTLIVVLVAEGIVAAIRDKNTRGDADHSQADSSSSASSASSATPS